ncbi:hypothetical protein F5887DRAFT_1077768 [Amanita rubescens]|nr:hypothetical protein F5887DRAFT_1077768 [Amanita rubescens]
MAETATSGPEARGFFKCEDGLNFLFEFIMDGVVKRFAGKFDYRITPFHVPVANLYYQHLDELYADFRIDVSRYHFVGPGNIRLPFVKHETTESTTFVIKGPVAGVLPEGFVVGGGGSWLVD